MSILQHLIPRLKREEGFSEHVYLDTTSNLTIGYGHNLAHLRVVEAGGVEVEGGRVELRPVNGISANVAELLLVGEVMNIMSTLGERLPWFVSMDDVRQEVLTDLCFNIGLGILRYKVFMRQLASGDYDGAASNMRGWRWYRQVHAHRADPLIRMMRTGVRE